VEEAPFCCHAIPSILFQYSLAAFEILKGHRKNYISKKKIKIKKNQFSHAFFPFFSIDLHRKTTVHPNLNACMSREVADASQAIIGN